MSEPFEGHPVPARWPLAEALCLLASMAWLVYAVLADTPIVLGMDAVGISRDFVIHRVVLLLGASELVRIWRREYGPRDAVFFVAFAVMSACAWRFDWPAMLCANLVVLCARNVRPRTIVGVGAVVVAVTVAVVIGLSLAGVIPDYVIEQSRGMRIRHCLGFTYPLFPAMHLFALTCVACWFRGSGKGLRVWEAVVLVAANVGVYVLTNSRLSAGLAIVCVVVALLGRTPIAGARPTRALAAIASWAFPLVVVATIALTVAYGATGGEGAMRDINRLLGSRVRFGYEGVTKLGVPLLGQHVDWVGNGLTPAGEGVQMGEGYNWVDNAFLHAAIQNGIVYALGMIALWTAVSRRALRAGDAMLVTVLAFMALHMAMDDLALSLHYNVLMFLWAGLGVGLGGPAHAE